MSQAYVVFDGETPIYCACYPEACHEHINDAINEFEIEGAGKWRVVKMAPSGDAQQAAPAVPEDKRDAPTGQVYGIIDPDYGRLYTIIRKLAWDEGYAIGMHGSFTRDLDLIAVPWAERICEPEHLIRRIVAATGVSSLPSNPGTKPHGRLVWTLTLPDFGDPRFVDLSIIAAAPKDKPSAPSAVATAPDAIADMKGGAA